MQVTIRQSGNALRRSKKDSIPGSADKNFGKGHGISRFTCFLCSDSMLSLTPNILHAKSIQVFKNKSVFRKLCMILDGTWEAQNYISQDLSEVWYQHFSQLCYSGGFTLHSVVPHSPQK